MKTGFSRLASTPATNGISAIIRTNAVTDTKSPLEKKPCVIWDLCQTLADTRHRLPFILNKPTNWLEFDKRTLEDTPIPSAKLVYHALMAQDVDQIIITGRSERTREMCELWMMQYEMHYSGMYMRPEGVTVPSAALKKYLLDRVRKEGWHPVLAFEDEPNTVRMYRSEGVPCFAADDHSWTIGQFREVKQA